MRNKRLADIAGDERGIGIIEIVISMFLIALLVLSFIPVLINSNRLSGRNTTMATATQIVNKQIQSARAVTSSTSTTPSCANMNNFMVSPAPSAVVDPRGVTLLAVWAPITCPSSYPGTVLMKVSITQSGYTSPTASAATLVRVVGP
jgi:Tfp pilus assembly protein PilV